jgi:hypothetical protein
VTSPRDCVSNVRVLYDGGQNSVSVAIIDWEGQPRFAMRWNVALREGDDPEKQSGRKVCAGMPMSRGHSVWFIVPDEMLDKNSEVWEAINKAKKGLTPAE